MSSSRYCILLLAVSVALPADAYELGTHGRLTFEAYKRSVVKVDPSLLRDLGVQDINNPFGTTYYDVAGNEVRSRAKHDFEQSAGRMPEEVDPLSVPGWLLRGAIREDDLGTILGVNVGDNPHDDPYGDFFRVFKHFFDPVHDRPLTTCFIEPGIGDRKAPDWAIGARDAFAEPLEPEVGRRNHFTVFDAREAMYRALTSKNADNEIIAPNAAERKKYWATAFRSLGDVIHLIQDMAAAQHTRNDPHAGKGPCTGHKSVFENYIEARATQSLDAKQRTQALNPTIITFPNLNYGNYPMPRFIKYADIFSTARRDGVEGGFGLADYSNRGFFSIGTNLGHNDYPLPPNDRAQFAEKIISIDADTKTSYLLDGVFDTLNPGLRALDVPKTKEGIWYEPLLEFADAGVAETHGYTLDQRIYDAQADLLIPRAVAYSAGLIDYFFRGRLGAVDPTFTDEGVSLKVENDIDTEKVPEWANENLYAQKDEGYFVVTVTYKQGKESRLVASDPINFTTQEFIKPGETADEILSFKLPTLPDNTTDVKYRLVFRGRIGQEDDAIAVGIVEPVSGFIVRPNYVPADGIAGNRLIVKSSGKWRRTEDRGLQAGNIDWKGWYENGRPTKVLSWFGPKARHFPDSSGDPFFSGVYQNGERFAVSSLDVLGAAIVRDADDNEWLIIIGKTGNSDLVLRRPNKKSDSPAFFDPVTNPEGWQVIGNFPWEPGFKPPNRPWFFNGDGTEAQTIREVQIDPTETNASGSKTSRLKITISNANVAFLENLGNIEGFNTTSASTQRMIKGTESCSYSTESSFESTGTYVVAVDYKDNKPVICQLTRQSEWNASRTLETLKNSGKNDIRTHVETVVSEASERLSCDGREFELNPQSQSRSVDLTWTVSGIDGKEETHGEGEIHNIDYLDSRYDLIVTSSFGSDSHYSLTPVGEGDSTGFGESRYAAVGDISVMRFGRDQVNHGGKIFTTFDSVETPTGLEGSVLFRFIAGSCSQFELTQTGNSRFYPSIISVATRTEGSWVVDSNGSLAVSQTVGANHTLEGTGEFFNHLTDGNLEQIIPEAPPDARYFPLYVIR